MCYYARFEKIAGHVFRFDTRIYLGAHDPSAIGECVGAIVGKNPGAAQPKLLDVCAPLQLKGDKLLPYVHNRFVEAYQKSGKVVPTNAFVQVWNLFYLCNQNLSEAFSTLCSVANPPLCPSECRKPKVVWFAWGDNDVRLNILKQRFLGSQHQAFYYDQRAGVVRPSIPSITDFARHTQGMIAMPIVNHLAGIL